MNLNDNESQNESSSKVNIPTINAAGSQLKGIIWSWLISLYIKIIEFMITIVYTNLSQQTK